MKGKFKFFLLLILLFYLLMEIFLPIIVERKLEKSIVENIDSVQSLAVDAHSFPAWEMILSKIDRVEIKASNLAVNGLLIDSISTKHSDVYLKKDKIMGENDDLQIVISEKAVNNYLAGKYPGLSNFRVNFIAEQAYLRGTINFFEQEIDIQLTGNFTSPEKNIIIFNPVNLKIAKLEIPGEVIKKYIEDTGFAINLNDLNIPLNIEDVKIDTSRICLQGGIYARKAGL